MNPWCQGLVIVHLLQTGYSNLPVLESCKLYTPQTRELSGCEGKSGCSREQFSDHGSQGSCLSTMGQTWPDRAAVPRTVHWQCCVTPCPEGLACLAGWLFATSLPIASATDWSLYCALQRVIVHHFSLSKARWKDNETIFRWQLGLYLLCTFIALIKIILRVQELEGRLS